MADKVSLASSSPAEKRFKFEPNEDYLNQLLAMGISLNGAKKVRLFLGLDVKRIYSRVLISRNFFTGIILHWQS